MMIWFKLTIILILVFNNIIIIFVRKLIELWFERIGWQIKGTKILGYRISCNQNKIIGWIGYNYLNIGNVIYLLVLEGNRQEKTNSNIFTYEQ